MTTNEIEKIITEFCDQPLNFYEKAEGVEWMRNMLTTLTQKHEEEKAALLNEVIEEVGYYNNGCGCCSSSGPEGGATHWIKEIAAKHNIDLSKTDVTTEI